MKHETAKVCSALVPRDGPTPEGVIVKEGFAVRLLGFGSKEGF